MSDLDDGAVALFYIAETGKPYVMKRPQAQAILERLKALERENADLLADLDALRAMKLPPIVGDTK